MKRLHYLSLPSDVCLSIFFSLIATFTKTSEFSGRLAGICVCPNALILASSFINIFSNLSFLSALQFPSFLPSVLHSLVCCWQETADVVVFANFAEISTFVLRTAFFWVISHRLVVFSYRRFGTTHRSYPETSRILLFSPLKSTV